MADRSDQTEARMQMNSAGQNLVVKVAMALLHIVLCELSSRISLFCNELFPAYHSPSDCRL
jgi:hypothetical protein